MRRPLALLAAVIALAAAPAGAGEPLDLDLGRLGAPTPEVWLGLPSGTAPSAADASALAADARVRFARLTTDLAMAFSTALLQPASTTGQTGFAFDLEGAYTGVSPGVIGTTTYGTSPNDYPREYWATRSKQPTGLFTPSIHVRKAFPFSLELGGRFLYLSQSRYFAAQVEGKWAMLEGFYVLPDVALRAAWTKMLGLKDLDLTTTELALMTSKRFGVNAVVSVTPYLALRLTRVNASTPELLFRANLPPPTTAGEVAARYAAFPNVASSLFRTTAGVRLTSFAVSMAAEATYYGGGTMGKDGADAAYPKYWVPASFSGGFKFGFEF